MCRGTKTGDTEEASRSSTPSGMGPRTQEERFWSSREDTGSGSGREARDKSPRDSLCFVLCHCPLQAGVRPDLPGSVHLAAATCHGRGTFITDPGKSMESSKESGSEQIME